MARPILTMTLLALAATGLAACGDRNPLRITRSACPAVAIPAYTGEVTLFTRPGSDAASDVDLVAAITNVRGGCTEAADNLITDASFQVQARRTDAGPARQVTLPWFAAVVQAGDRLVTKQVGQVTLNFAAGEERATATASARSEVARSAATLPAAINQRLTRERKTGDLDAALDPMAEPEVRNAVREHSFEVLVGFQLQDDQLAFNVNK